MSTNQSRNTHNSNENEDRFHYHPKGENTDIVTFTTYVEVDMHKEPTNIHDIFDWIPIIRDTISEASKKYVNYTCFITGIGSHSSELFKPKLRPLVILTAKQLGYDCFIDEENHGVVIVDISSFTDINARFELSEDWFRSSGFYSDMNHDELHLEISHCDEEIINNLQNQFPLLSYSCAKMICCLNDGQNNYQNAVEFAQRFIEKLYKNNNSNSDEDIDLKKNCLQEMKTVKMCKDEYNLDQEIIERVVHEKQNDMEHIHIVLDKIIKDIPNEFYIDLIELISKYGSTEIENILSAMKEAKYNKEETEKKLANDENRRIRKSLNVIRLPLIINAIRDDGQPCFLPVIEIDLTKASAEKAIKTVSRLINGLADGPFSRINLKFARNASPNICTANQVIPQVMQNAAFNHYNIDNSESPYLRKGYNFLISNPNVDHVADFNDLIILNKKI